MRSNSTLVVIMRFFVSARVFFKSIVSRKRIQEREGEGFPWCYVNLSTGKVGHTRTCWGGRGVWKVSATRRADSSDPSWQIRSLFLFLDKVDNGEL